jgi:hypothetical protein
MKQPKYIPELIDKEGFAKFYDRLAKTTDISEEFFESLIHEFIHHYDWHIFGTQKHDKSFESRLAHLKSMIREKSKVDGFFNGKTCEAVRTGQKRKYYESKKS